MGTFKEFTLQVTSKGNYSLSTKTKIKQGVYDGKYLKDDENNKVVAEHLGEDLLSKIIEFVENINNK